MSETVEELVRGPAFGLTQAEKDALLLPRFKMLCAHHASACPDYGKLADLFHPGWRDAGSLEDIPFLPVGLFKSRVLSSIPEGAITGWVTSSGTTGAAVSRVPLDATSARMQALALASVMREALGPARLPMIIVDSRDTLTAGAISARAAGILGMMKFGRDHLFALDSQMRLDRSALTAFLDKHGGKPFALFGFTFMVWRHLHREMEAEGMDLSNGTLIHSGGWKKLADEAVDAATFRAALTRSCGLSNIRNFYGMAEQIGTVHLEGEDGLLHPPAFADVIIRDPADWRPVPPGKAGIVQVLSLLPGSYPGHSLLTEDIGVVETIDQGGLLGKGLRILGRAPRAERRGCSDVYGSTVA
ncbi:acyl-protein synthetase [Telmatospirillum sp. J64-1]|uniref:LuxE/PaaK family acyltransferase n=1 Tax=Telmatospirillum sp. J64-1 TaxID=2502183 RepID=UPI00115DB255|nr:acyl-protein synthetase [Telmatospirillum sp. J64-1]